ncbi:putative metal-binding motif-containing protein, partial [Candidatus Woesearchaeota archaeon]|nr:putative metal-binding motif-containing protein [Candidatus Woesearchaeota archaeon]
DSDGYDTCDLGVPDQLDNNVADCDDDDESIYKLSSIYYPDNDLDTYFAKFTSEVCCGVSVPDGWQSFAGGDCDDDNPNINPTKPDICGNNIDENCDGTYALCPACVIDAEVLPSGCDCLNVPCYQGYCCSDGCSNQDCFYIGP